MQWDNLPDPSHLRGGAAATAFFHHICDYILLEQPLYIFKFERQFKIFADGLQCFHTEFWEAFMRF